MNESEIINHVELCINKLCEKFRQNPDYFVSLREQDLVAYLYHLICLNPSFLEEIDYVDNDGNNIKTKLIETQTPTFEKINTKTGTFDLTILNPDQSPDRKDNLIAMEFKWIGSLNNKNLLETKDDLDKLNNEKNEVKFGYLLVFNSDAAFDNDFKDEILDYNRNPNTNIIFVERK